MCRKNLTRPGDFTEKVPAESCTLNPRAKAMAKCNVFTKKEINGCFLTLPIELK